MFAGHYRDPSFHSGCVEPSGAISDVRNPTHPTPTAPPHPAHDASSLSEISPGWGWWWAGGGWAGGGGPERSWTAWAMDLCGIQLPRPLICMRVRTGTPSSTVRLPPSFCVSLCTKRFWFRNRSGISVKDPAHRTGDLCKQRSGRFVPPCRYVWGRLEATSRGSTSNPRQRLLI